MISRFYLTISISGSKLDFMSLKANETIIAAIITTTTGRGLFLVH